MSSKTTYIICGLLIFIVIYFGYDNLTREDFVETPYVSATNLEKYYESPTKGIENYLVDNMTCSPECCGSQGQIPLDGLMPDEIKKCVNGAKDGQYVRTNYMCGNGINGVGCPCISKKAYKFMANHGFEPSSNLIGIEPTLIMNVGLLPGNDQTYTPYEQIQAKKSPYSDKRMLNDLELRRPVQDLSDVQQSQ
jgi:hypothetical protein